MAMLPLNITDLVSRIELKKNKTKKTNKQTKKKTTTTTKKKKKKKHTHTQKTHKKTDVCL